LAGKFLKYNYNNDYLPLFTLSGMVRIGANLLVVSENIFWKSINTLIVMRLYLFFCLFISEIAAQPFRQGTLFIEVKGREMPHIGFIQEENRDTVVLKTAANDLVYIPRKTIVHIDFVSAYGDPIDLSSYEKKQHTGTYLAQSSNFQLPAGEGRYRNLYGLFNHAEVGITQHFSIGAGFAPLFVLGEGGLTPFWIVPKLSFRLSPKTHFGITTIIARGVDIPSKNDHESFGAAAATFTFGRHNQNISIGGGIARNGENERFPFLTVASVARLSVKWLFVSENLVFKDEYGDFYVITTQGVRYIFKKWSLNVGVMAIIDLNYREVFGVLPVIGFSIPF